MGLVELDKTDGTDVEAFPPDPPKPQKQKGPEGRTGEGKGAGRGRQEGKMITISQHPIENFR